MLSEADKTENEYFKLRVKALISIVKKFGKRRAEIAALEGKGLKVENGKLLITYTLRKNTKKSCSNTSSFQRKQNPSLLKNHYQSLSKIGDIDVTQKTVAFFGEPPSITKLPITAFSIMQPD